MVDTVNTGSRNQQGGGRSFRQGFQAQGFRAPAVQAACSGYRSRSSKHLSGWQVIFLNLAPTTSHPAVAMPDDLFYAIIGDKDLHSIDKFDETWTVNTLKKRIKEEKAHMLASYHVDTLTLYKVNIDISNKQIYPGIMEQIRQRSIMADKEALIAAYKLSRYWGESELPKRTIHILVEFP